MRKIATVCLLLLIATCASADAIDTYLRTEMANQRIPGVAVAVLRDGKVRLDDPVKTYLDDAPAARSGRSSAALRLTNTSCTAARTRAIAA